MKFFVITLSIFLVVNFLTLSQERNKSVFVSGLVGAAQVNNSRINTRESVAITFGGSFGIPITNKLFIYARSSFSSKSNFQSYYNSSYLTSQIDFSDELVKVNSSFSLLLVNGGLLYNFPLYKDLLLGISAGVSFAVVNQEANLIGGHVVSSIDNENIWGYFGGLSLEKSWGEENITTFGELQYNYANSDAYYIASALNAVNFTFGIRYYLNGRSF